MDGSWRPVGSVGRFYLGDEADELFEPVHRGGHLQHVGVGGPERVGLRRQGLREVLLQLLHALRQGVLRLRRRVLEAADQHALRLRQRLQLRAQDLHATSNNERDPSVITNHHAKTNHHSCGWVGGNSRRTLRTSDGRKPPIQRKNLSAGVFHMPDMTWNTSALAAIALILKRCS